MEQNSPQINRRRLQIVISGALAVAAAVYGVSLMVPTYGVFAEEFAERRVWKAAGWDDEEVRRKAIDVCNSSCKVQPRTGPFPDEDLSACEQMCTRPMWDPWRNPAPPPWEIPLAFLKSEWPRMMEYVLAVLFGSWLFGFLVVRALPAGVSRFWQWLRTPNDSH